MYIYYQYNNGHAFFCNMLSKLFHVILLFYLYITIMSQAENKFFKVHFEKELEEQY